MATRFYPDPTNAPDVSPDWIGYGSPWGDTSQGVRRKLVLGTPGNNASTDFTVSETSATLAYKVLVIQFVSEPLDSFAATSVLFDWAFRCIENAAKSDARFYGGVGKCDSDGSNSTNFTWITEGTEFDDGYLTNRYALRSITTALSQGDRLIVEVGVSFGNSKTDSYSGTINVTDNHATTDLPENDTETTAYNSWIETGDTFTEASGEPATIKLGPMFAFA